MKKCGYSLIGLPITAYKNTMECGNRKNISTYVSTNITNRYVEESLKLLTTFPTITSAPQTGDLFNLACKRHPV